MKLSIEYQQEIIRTLKLKPFRIANERTLKISPIEADVIRKAYCAGVSKQQISVQIDRSYGGIVGVLRKDAAKLDKRHAAAQANFMQKKNGKKKPKAKKVAPKVTKPKPTEVIKEEPEIKLSYADIQFGILMGDRRYDFVREKRMVA